jgi:hypothetical protein
LCARDWVMAMAAVRAGALRSRIPGYVPGCFRFGHGRDGGGRRGAAGGDRTGLA